MYVQGPVHKRIFTKYRSELENMKSATNTKELKKWAENFCAGLDEAMPTRISNEKESSRLDSYSPYLAHFSEEIITLEVPAQYFGKEKPLASHRAKIARFENSVQVQGGSLRISMIGTDARTYDFLVRIGTSARQEERAQRILEMLNDSLRRDTCCREKRLLVNTSSVVSLSRLMSLTRWTEGTKSLQDCVEFSMSDRSTLKAVATKYRNWIEEADDEKTTSKSHVYKRALMKYSAVEVIAKMRKLDGCIPWDLLRKTFVRLSTSADCFIQVNSHF
jgi:hypothetical protein